MHPVSSSSPSRPSLKSLASALTPSLPVVPHRSRPSRPSAAASTEPASDVGIRLRQVARAQAAKPSAVRPVDMNFKLKSINADVDGGVHWLPPAGALRPSAKRFGGDS